MRKRSSATNARRENVNSARGKQATKRTFDKKKRGASEGPEKFSAKKGPGRASSGATKKSFFTKRSETSHANTGGTKSSFRKSDQRNVVAEVKESSADIRLNKFIANSGVCSRREADQLIEMGLISVNGKVITELGFKVTLDDEVRYERKVLNAEKHVYILLNKPKGFLTTTKDPEERRTVMELIGKSIKERVYPVGRLDRNTTGLLLLTNDGDLAEKLSHPSYDAKKIYKVELDRGLTRADLQKISEGVMLDEGRAMVDDVAIISTDAKTVGLEIHIGWNRVVRRIFESLNYEVLRLDRTMYAGLDKKDLPRGEWRFLRKDEVIRLKHFNKKK